MKIHIVQKGDTLWSIAEKYGVDFEQLKSVNVHISSPDMIMPGMKIKVPTEDKHVKHKTKKQPAYSSPKLQQEKSQAKQKPSKLVEKESWANLEQSTLPSPLPLPNISDSTKGQHQTSHKDESKNLAGHQTNKHQLVEQHLTNQPPKSQQYKSETYMPYVTPMNCNPMPMYPPMTYLCPSCCAMNYQGAPPYPMMNQPYVNYGNQPYIPVNEQPSFYGNMPVQQDHVNYYK